MRKLRAKLFSAMLTPHSHDGRRPPLQRILYDRGMTEGRNEREEEQEILILYVLRELLFKSAISFKVTDK